MSENILNLVPVEFLCPVCGRWHEIKNDEGYTLREIGKIERLSCESYPFCSSIMFRTSAPDTEITVCFNAAGVNLRYYGGEYHFDISEFQKAIGNGVWITDAKPIYMKFGDTDSMTKTEFRAAFKLVPQTHVFDKLIGSEKNIDSEGRKIADEKMQSNSFPLGIEFGKLDDENIVSTIMGFAVKSDDGYKLYDKEKHQIINVGEVENSSFESFILPVTSVKEGDLIKNSDEYYYVMSVENNVVKTLSAKTGEIKEIIPTKSILGAYSYSKVVSIMDYMKAEDDASIQKLALIMSLNNNCSDITKINPLLLLNNNMDKDTLIIMLLMQIISKLNLNNSNKNN